MPSNSMVIVGNGPSATPELLESFGCPSFGMNFVSKIYPKTTWRPTHYVFGNAPFDEPQSGFPSVMESVNLGIPCYVRDEWVNDIKGDNVRYFKVHRLFDLNGVVQEAAYGWPTSIDHLPGSGTAVYLAAEIAVLLGFKHLIFLGLDGYKPWQGKDPNHLTEDYFDYKHSFDQLVSAFVNVSSIGGYMKLVAHLKHLGIACSFVVPPSKIGLEV